MAYKDGEIMRLNEVEDLGITPNKILDIGAHSGQFYKWAKDVWPMSQIFMIEANPLHIQSLKGLTFMMDDDFMIAALGDEEREVTFFTRKDKPHTEGNSYYKEANYWDIPNLVLENKIKLTKLDNIFAEEEIFDLIKIDTQGSEIDIIKGGLNVVKKSKAVVLEVSYIEHNLGSPTSDECIKFMDEIGFEQSIDIGEHYDDGDVVQKDILFLNREKK